MGRKYSTVQYSTVQYSTCVVLWWVDQPSSTMPSATHRDEVTSSGRRANLRISRAPSVEAASLESGT